MAIDCKTTRTVYHAIPKVACTSLKTLFWTLNTEGRPLPVTEQITKAVRFVRGLPPRPLGVHHRPGYETVSFNASHPIPDGYEAFAVVRDPLSRLKSAWANKVTRKRFEHREEDRALKAQGLALPPGFPDFVMNYDAYRCLSGAVRDHTENYSVYLGPEISAPGRLFRMEAMAPLQDWLSERAGRRLEIPRENKGGPAGRDASVPVAIHDRLRAITRADYDWLAGMYRFDEGLARL